MQRVGCSRFGLYAALLALAAATASAQPEPRLADGETQLGVILRDRPQLAAIVREYDELRRWLIAEFDRQQPSPLWDPREPVSGRAAEHEYPSLGGTAPAGTAIIRVSSQTSGWDQLAGLVFELHNLRRSGRFGEIYRAAVRGDIDKAGYVRQSLEQEFAALQATRRFLERLLPAPARDSSPLLQQIMDTGNSLEAHLESHEEEGQSLRAHFERMYEREVVPEMRRIGAREP